VEQKSVYDLVGGEEFFVQLVERFYVGVDADPILRPLYPQDLTESKDHLALFLIQYFGGPTTYNEKRGHPRLRMRHAPYVIGPKERDAWLTHMLAALDGAQLDKALDETVRSYFVSAAHSLQNSLGSEA